MELKAVIPALSALKKCVAGQIGRFLNRLDGQVCLTLLRLSLLRKVLRRHLFPNLRGQRDVELERQTVAVIIFTFDGNAVADASIRRMARGVTGQHIALKSRRIPVPFQLIARIGHRIHRQLFVVKEEFRHPLHRKRNAVCLLRKQNDIPNIGFFRVAALDEL